VIMRHDQEIDVDIIRRNRREENRVLKAMILDVIEERGETYSMGTGINAPTREVRAALEDLEEAGDLVSELRDPPFEDGGRWIRRYYRKIGVKGLSRRDT
jgi:hypothetical protein